MTREMVIGMFGALCLVACGGDGPTTSIPDTPSPTLNNDTPHSPELPTEPDTSDTGPTPLVSGDADSTDADASAPPSTDTLPDTSDVAEAEDVPPTPDTVVGPDDDAEVTPEEPDVPVAPEDTPIVSPDAPCTPDCEDKACGEDGCGGTCGSCSDAETCIDGGCVCAPDCGGKQCGDDGCGGTCGSCSDAETCVDGDCVCAPDCGGKQCGDDGCGGTCGSCGEQSVCLGGSCVCAPDCDGKQCGDDGCGGTCGSCEDNNPCTIDFCAPDQSCSATELALQPCADPPCAINGGCLYDLARSGLNTTERMAAISLQGILAQHRPAFWLGEGQSDPIHQARLDDEYGVTFVPESSLWALMARFQGAVSGYLLYDPATSSQSVAMSLAGVLGAVAISPDLEAQAQAAGLSLAQDVRGLDEAWCWETYAGQFATEMLVEQSESSGFGEWLLDFPIARRAFVYFDATCGDLRTQLASQLDGPLIYGWGAECGEYEFVKGASEGGASVVAADYSSNLSVLSNVSGVPLTGNHHAPEVVETEDDVHYVAFIMSDGDNIQFLQNAFDDPRWWGSAHRGTFPMGWEVSPVLPDAAPTILQWLYESATEYDQAVSGPSGAGYALPSFHTDPQGLAQKTGEAMAQTDMRVMTLLNSGGGLEAGDAFTARPEIDAVIYKDFADYNGQQGALRWSNGKPIMAFRYLLWDNDSFADSPQGVAQSINAAPTNPTGDIASYSLINIHAWSEWPDNPMGSGATDAAAWTVSMFDDDVRVVSAETLLKHLTQNLSGSTDESVSLSLEAETDLSHQMGYADGDGWACNTADQSAGHMCYGPYTSALSPGGHTADFVLMVDVPGPPATDDLVVTLDVFDSASGTFLTMRDVSRYEFDEPFTYKTFSLPFTNPAGSVLEFRVFWHATSYVRVDKVLVY